MWFDVSVRGIKECKFHVVDFMQRWPALFDAIQVNKKKVC